jgi:biotin carboxyl carrier protein
MTPFIKIRALKAIVTIVYLIIIIGLSGCGNRNGKAEETVDARTPVTVIQPGHKSISETLEFPAVSVFIRKNIIRTTTTGTIEQIFVTLGDQVKKGMLLFAVRTLEASVIQGSVHGDTSLIFKGIIQVYSPDDGIVNSISHQNGDFVQSGDELAVLADQNSLVFSLEIPFELRKYIEQTETCLLRLPDSTLIKGIIGARMSEMNIQSQTLSYYVRPLTSDKLPQNLIAAAIINKQTNINVQVLPRSALLGNETQTEFWIMKVLNDSTAVKVPVRIGIENYYEVEITDPEFFPDDKILVKGNYGLPDTAEIIIMK